MIVATRERKANGREPSKVYKCRSILDSAPCAHRANASAELLESAVEELFLAGWGPEPEYVTVRHADQQREKLALMAERIDGLYAALAKAKGPARRAERAELTEQIDQAEAELAEAEKTAPSSSWTYFKRTGRTLGEVWLAGDVDERRALLKKKVGILRIAPGKPGARKFDMARIIDRDKLAGQQDDSAHWDEWAEADEWMPEADEWEPEADDVIDLAPGEPERLGLN